MERCRYIQAAGESGALEGARRGRRLLCLPRPALWPALGGRRAGPAGQPLQRVALLPVLRGDGRVRAAADGQPLAGAREPHHQGRITAGPREVLPRSGPLAVGLHAALVLRTQPEADARRAGQLPAVVRRTRGARARGQRRRPSRPLGAASRQHVASKADERLGWRGAGCVLSVGAPLAAQPPLPWPPLAAQPPRSRRLRALG